DRAKRDADPSLGEDFGWSLLDGVTVTLPGSGGGIRVSPGRVPPTPPARARVRPRISLRLPRKALRATTAPAATAVVVPGPSIPKIAPLFKATVKLPQPVGGALRLVVKELELH